MPDYADIVRRYTRARALGRQLGTALFSLSSKDTTEQAAKQIGMWIRGTIVFADMDQTGVLADFAIHDCRVDGRNALDHYLALHPPAPQSEEEAVLAAMQRSWYSVFQVESVVPGAGVHVHDIPLDQRHFLADIGFSQTAVKGLVLATRVFPFADFLMTSGAALPVDADTLEQIARLESLPENQNLAAMSPQRRAEFNAAIIRLCLSAKNAPQIRYQDIGEEPDEQPETPLPSRPPGRNEPCPCGSGKKYKKCCGK